MKDASHYITVLWVAHSLYVSKITKQIEDDKS